MGEMKLDDPATTTASSSATTTATLSSSNPSMARQSVAKSSASKAQDELLDFTSKWSLPAPVYSVIADSSSAPGKGKRSATQQQAKQFYGKVVIGESDFKTFPESVKSENAAREMVAKQALAKLTSELVNAEKSDSSKSSYHVNFLVEEILSIVKDTPQGMLDKHIEEEYMKRFNRLTPGNWLHVVRTTESQLEVQEANYNRKITIISLRPLPTIKYKSGWMDVKDYFDVKITRTVTPSDFWIQNVLVASPDALYASESSSDDFRQLVQDMSDYYSKAEHLETMTKDEIKTDRIMAGKEVRQDGTIAWHRILIHGSNDSDEITGLLVDNGCCMQFSMSDIQLLPENLRSLPKQAQQAALHGLRPIADHWSDREIDTFRDIVLNKPFVAKIVSADKNTVYIKLIDTSASTDEEDKDVDLVSLLIDRQVGQVNADAAA